MKKTLIFISIISIVMQCAVCKAVEPIIPGLKGIGEALVTKFGGEDPRVPPSGNEGPVDEGGYRYMASPWTCLNFVNGNVHISTKYGMHHLKVNKYKIIDETTNKLKLEKTCIDECDEQYIPVDIDEVVNWRLRGIYHTKTGISISPASGTMKGRPMDLGHANTIVSLITFGIL